MQPPGENAALKTILLRFKQQKIRLSIMQAIPFWIASILTGLVAVLYAKLFALAEELGMSVFHLHRWSVFLLTPACFVAAWWVVRRFSAYAQGSGIPQVMAAIELANPVDNHQVDKLLNLKVILVKCLSSLLMITGGGAIGREGPTIQIAGSIFRKVDQWLPKSWPKVSKKNMILTGAAAGLAAAFNTPLGGIVFAVEELAKTHISYFKTAIFTAVIISGLTAQALLGPYLYLGYPDVSNISNYIFFGVVVVAIISGLSGSLMGKLIYQAMVWKSKIKYRHKDLLYILGCAIVISLIAYFVNDGVLGSGKAQMSQALFTGSKDLGWQMPFVRVLGPVLSFTIGSAGGVFAPSLGAGAAIGSVIGSVAHLPAAETNLLILSGMVAFLTGVTRSPFTSAILVLEMTDRHSVIFHLMLAGMIASLVATLVSKHSLYDYLKFQYIDRLRKEDMAALPAAAQA